MLVVAKLVTWTLDRNRPHKTGSRYNDIQSCIGKPKGLLQTHKKWLSHSVAYETIFGRNHTGRHFTLRCWNKG